MRITFIQLLTLIFIALKVADVIDWSWWLVLLPFYGVLAVAVAIFISVIIIEFFDHIFRGHG